MKPTFLNKEKPMLTAMLQSTNPTDFIALARIAIQDGADAFGLQIEQLDREFRTEKDYKNMFFYTDNLPIYVTNYRGSKNDGKTDEDLAEELKLCAKCGATLLDVMGNYYDRGAKDELTLDKTAIDKQRKLIDEFHEMGAEVLMSSHTLRVMNHDEVLSIVSEHEKRGADIAKIVTKADTEEEMLETIKTATLLKHELKIPYLFLCGGAYAKMLRNIGPFLGCCMWLTVPTYDRLSTPAQPLLRSMRAVRDNFDYLPHRIID